MGGARLAGQGTRLFQTGTFHRCRPAEGFRTSLVFPPMETTGRARSDRAAPPQSRNASPIAYASPTTDNAGKAAGHRWAEAQTSPRTSPPSPDRRRQDHPTSRTIVPRLPAPGGRPRALAIIFGHGHGFRRAIVDESQQSAPERLVVPKH